MAGRSGFFKLGVRLGFGIYKKGYNSRFWFSVILVPLFLRVFLRPNSTLVLLPQNKMAAFLRKFYKGRGTEFP